jgi:type III secretion protein U
VLSGTPGRDALVYGLGLLVAVLLAGWVAALAQRGGFLRGLSGQAGAGFTDADAPPQLTAADRALVTSWTLAKWLGLGAVLIWPLAGSAAGIFGAWQRSPPELLAIVTRVGSELLARAAFVLAVLGAIDLGVQHWLFRRRLRMSRSEWRQERRAMEADPQLALERRRRASELRAEATLSELAETTLALSDGRGTLLAFRREPTSQEGGRLLLWIKATDPELSLRLSAAARARGIPVARDPGLVAALRGLEIGESPERTRAAALAHYLRGPLAALEREDAPV